MQTLLLLSTSMIRVLTYSKENKSSKDKPTSMLFPPLPIKWPLQGAQLRKFTTTLSQPPHVTRSGRSYLGNFHLLAQFKSAPVPSPLFLFPPVLSSLPASIQDSPCTAIPHLCNSLKHSLTSCLSQTWPWLQI